jgi:hypothetical protein
MIPVSHPTFRAGRLGRFGSRPSQRQRRSQRSDRCPALGGNATIMHPKRARWVYRTRWGGAAFSRTIWSSGPLASGSGPLAVRGQPRSRRPASVTGPKDRNGPDASDDGRPVPRAGGSQVLDIVPECPRGTTEMGVGAVGIIEDLFADVKKWPETAVVIEGRASRDVLRVRTGDKLRARLGTSVDVASVPSSTGQPSATLRHLRSTGERPVYGRRGGYMVGGGCCRWCRRSMAVKYSWWRAA